jgi:hypothetical protein
MGKRSEDGILLREKFSYFIFRFSTIMLHVKSWKDKLDELCEGKKDKKTGFWVLTAGLLKIQVFWDVTPCLLVRLWGLRWRYYDLSKRRLLFISRHIVVIPPRRSRRRWRLKAKLSLSAP